MLSYYELIVKLRFWKTEWMNEQIILRRVSGHSLRAHFQVKNRKTTTWNTWWRRFCEWSKGIFWNEFLHFDFFFIFPQIIRCLNGQYEAYLFHCIFYFLGCYCCYPENMWLENWVVEYRFDFFVIFCSTFHSIHSTAAPCIRSNENKEEENGNFPFDVVHSFTSSWPIVLLISKF